MGCKHKHDILIFLYLEWSYVALLVGLVVMVAASMKMWLEGQVPIRTRWLILRSE